MWIYSLIMFLVAALFGGLSIGIYKGKTNLIHDYHQTKVTDKKAYGKAFGKALGVLPVSMTLSGILGLFEALEGMALVAVGVLLMGLGIGIRCILSVQRKYNQGVF